MVSKNRFVVSQGLVTLGPEAVEIKRLLEARFLEWAGQTSAVEMAFPALMRARDLENLDYFKNFPHLALMASNIRKERLAEYSKGMSLSEGEGGCEVDREHLTGARYVLPSAACYNIYLHMRDTVLDGPRYITVVANCFRNETHYDGLRRLLGFTMREIVCVGSAEAVQAHLSAYKQRVQEFISGLGLKIQIEVATDPFYESQGARATLQRLFPVKEEFVYGESLAIASVNFHRNFFGERCGISTADGAAAFSGCVAFGLERWLHALFEHFGNDLEAIRQALSRE